MGKILIQDKEKRGIRPLLISFVGEWLVFDYVGQIAVQIGN
jgi:hypothetical protein